MKTFRMLFLTTLLLCYTFGISQGAIIMREISDIDNPEIKEFVDEGSRAIGQLFLGGDAVGDITETDSTVNHANPIDSLTDHIIKYVAFMKLAETGKMASGVKTDKENVLNTALPPSKNVIVGSNCNWDANIFKCCQSSVPTKSSCLVAEVLEEKIKLTHQIGNESIWTRYLSYKSNIESLLRGVSQDVHHGNMDPNTINWEDIFRRSMIFTEKEDEDFTEVPFSNKELTANVSGKHCSWNGRVGECWVIIKVQKSYKVTFRVELAPPLYLKLAFLIDGRVRWSKEYGINKNSAHLCIKPKICFEISWSRLPSSGFQVCFKVVRFLGIKIKMRPLCIRKGFVLDEISASTNSPNPFKDDNRHDEKVPIDNDLDGNNLFIFE